MLCIFKIPFFPQNDSTLTNEKKNPITWVLEEGF